jgi:hypothetical protein
LVFGGIDIFGGYIDFGEGIQVVSKKVMATRENLDSNSSICNKSIMMFSFLWGSSQIGIMNVM